MKDNYYVLWVLIALWYVLYLLFTFFVLVPTSYKHEYPPGDPDNLYSERWNVDYWMLCINVLILLIPLSAAFLISSPERSPGRLFFHVACLLIVFILFAFPMTIIVIWNYVDANKGTLTNAGNPANDVRWCNVYYTIAPKHCSSFTSPTPGIMAEMLLTNPTFLWRFCIHIFFLAYMALHGLYVWTVLVPHTLQKELNDPLLPTLSRLKRTV